MSNRSCALILIRCFCPARTLTEFVEESVRRAVEFRRVQTDFAARVKQLGK
ncbi:hypothetical protein [Aquabacterium olei]|uniref:hypothetical protein n=1 Tax=Aquabacterium olei TaxID=1296669 RepID=UPI00131F0EDE|nr:hypothetical protein [Aquabacterium olei]